MSIFKKKKNCTWAPWNFFKKENFDASAPKIWIWTSKVIPEPDLWLVDMF